MVKNIPHNMEDIHIISPGKDLKIFKTEGICACILVDPAAQSPDSSGAQPVKLVIRLAGAGCQAVDVLESAQDAGFRSGETIYIPLKRPVARPYAYLIVYGRAYCAD